MSREPTFGTTSALLGSICLLVAACQTTPSPREGSEEARWSASSKSAARFGVKAWSLAVSEDGATADLVGEGDQGEVARARLERVLDRDPARSHYALVFPDGEIDFSHDGSVSKRTLPTDWRRSTWEGVLLASWLDRVAAAPTEQGSVRPQSLDPGVIEPGPGSLLGPPGGLLKEPAEILLGCQGARGEEDFWTAAQAALACSSSADSPARSRRSEYPYDAPPVAAGNFDATPARCAASQAVLAKMDERPGCDPFVTPIQTASLIDDIVGGAGRSLCFAGVAVGATATGALTYWVCEGTAVLASAAGCTLMAPGFGTVGCGAAGAVGAQPVCLAGGAAMAAGAAAAGLSVCAVVAPSNVEDGPRVGVSDWSQVGQYNCKRDAANDILACAKDAECGEGLACDTSSGCGCCVDAPGVQLLESDLHGATLTACSAGRCAPPPSCLPAPDGRSCETAYDGTTYMWATSYQATGADLLTDTRRELCMKVDPTQMCMWMVDLAPGSYERDGPFPTNYSGSYECGGKTCNGAEAARIAPKAGVSFTARLVVDGCTGR